MVKLNSHYSPVALPHLLAPNSTRKHISTDNITTHSLHHPSIHPSIQRDRHAYIHTDTHTYVRTTTRKFHTPREAAATEGDLTRSSSRIRLRQTPQPFFPTRLNDHRVRFIDQRTAQMETSSTHTHTHSETLLQLTRTTKLRRKVLVFTENPRLLALPASVPEPLPLKNMTPRQSARNR